MKMVKVSDCTCCDCDSAQEKEQIKERALSSINKVYTFDNRTFWPDGTGMVTLPLPTQEQLNKIEDIGDLSDQVDKNTAGLNTANELIAGEQTQIDSLKTTLETSYQAIVQKGSANGYAGLDNNARVPLAQLYAGTSANQVPLIGKQLLANEMLVVDADGLTVRSKPIVQTLSFRGIYPSKAALPTEGNVSGDYAIVSDGTAQDDTGYYVWGYNVGTSEYEWVWTILFDANSYQLISNLVTEISSDSDDSHYPSAKAVKDYHDASIGTVEQEIDAINNDVAEIQQTVNTHTTEITAVNTLANRAYDDVEIADNVMTFTRGNGGTTQIKIPQSQNFDIQGIYSKIDNSYKLTISLDNALSGTGESTSGNNRFKRTFTFSYTGSYLTDTKIPTYQVIESSKITYTNLEPVTYKYIKHIYKSSNPTLFNEIINKTAQSFVETLTIKNVKTAEISLKAEFNPNNDLNEIVAGPYTIIIAYDEGNFTYSSNTTDIVAQSEYEFNVTNLTVFYTWSVTDITYY